MKRTRGAIRIGISGWRYAGWRGVFYPEGLVQRRELEYAASIFNSVEINGTHYSLQRPEHFERWAAETPRDFRFAVKGSRFITHMLKLKGAHTALANFFAQGLLCLGKKLGPILWQFPERFRYDPDRLEPFLAALPRTHEQAAELARQHDHHLKGRAHTEALVSGRLRHAVEIRSDTFATPAFIKQLRRHRVALVVADTVAWPCLMDLTAGFVYCRLHGSRELYTSGYEPDDIARWAARVEAWARGGEPADAQRVLPTAGPTRKTRDVYVYFDNDAKVRAPFDAQALMARVGVS